MSTKYDKYRSSEAPVPNQTWAWNMYGVGVENIGRDGKPEQAPIVDPASNQLLVRIDAVGMCFSDVKLIKQGGQHPKLYDRDLANDPTRLGHEVSMTIIKVGEELADQYTVGQRLAVQPDIYDAEGKSTAYGYTIPGGLTQYHLIGPEVLNVKGEAFVLPVPEDEMGYAEAALTEPWACVEAAYTQRRRLDPKVGGTMWIIGQPDDPIPYQFNTALNAPSTIILTDVPYVVKEQVERQVAERQVSVIERDGLTSIDYVNLKADLTNDAGFDDVIMLNPTSAKAVSEAAKQVARRGTLNLVGETPLDGLVEADVGRLHYDYIAFVGNPGPDIDTSYGEARNRCDLQPDGTAVFIGAGGPMGQMHVQRAIELPNGPSLIIATDINDMRLNALQDRFGALAEANETRLILINPQTSEESLRDQILQLTDGQGADDVIVSVPVAPLMAEGATLMNDNGMLVLFAGVPNGTFAPLNLSSVYLHNAQFTGTSGSALADQALVIQKTIDNELSPNRSVAAVGGLEAAREGVEAMMSGQYPGKVVIFPQLTGLPLIGIDELKEKYPDVAQKLAPGDVWTPDAEAALIEKFWQS